ncbi:hypothetical protein QBC36DRAFT_297497 [Triangularia setosa]|uniref:Uncharacterized protein n=1 Tax=Triangularia setosa TaxID=2587417 RepID=A0AAN6WF97_9PEZI|nr:hypothetical protein QBC36DRAFT_297497 [Podospora setosa]
MRGLSFSEHDTPYQRGERHGIVFKEEIELNIVHYRNYSGFPDDFKLVGWCNALREKLSVDPEWTPIMDELEGIADGAEVRLNDIIMLNARHELAAWGRTCRELAVAANHNQRLWPIQDLHNQYPNSKPTLDQNILSEYVDTSTSAYFSDAVTNNLPVTAHSWNMSTIRIDTEYKADERPPRNVDVVVETPHPVILLEIHPHREDGHNTMSQFIVTKPGVLMMSGMNICGLSVVLDTIFSSRDRKLLADDIPMVLIARRMLTSCDTVKKSIIMLGKYRYGSSRSLLLSQSGVSWTRDDYEHGYGLNLEALPDSLDAEGTVTRYKEHRCRRPLFCLLHTNHILLGDHLQLPEVANSLDSPLVEAGGRPVNFKYRAADSCVRWNRLQSLTKENSGYIRNKDILDFFSDHEDEPESLCQHTKKDLFKELSEVLGVLERPWRRPQNNHTACFVAYHLNPLKITVSTGPPCEGNTLVFRFHLAPSKREGPASVEPMLWETGHDSLEPDTGGENPDMDWENPDTDWERMKAEKDAALALGLDKKFKKPQKPTQIKPPKPEDPNGPRKSDKPKKRHLVSQVVLPSLDKKFILHNRDEIDLTCAVWWGEYRKRIEYYRWQTCRQTRNAIYRGWRAEQQRQRELFKNSTDGNRTECAEVVSEEGMKRRQEQEQRRLHALRLLEARWQIPGRRQEEKIVGDDEWDDDEIIGTPPTAAGEDRKLPKWTMSEAIEIGNHPVGVKALCLDSAAARMGARDRERWRLANGMIPRGSSLLRNVKTWKNDENEVRQARIKFDETTGHRLFMPWGRPLRDLVPPPVIDYPYTQRRKLQQQKKRYHGLWQLEKKARIENLKREEREEEKRARKREAYQRKLREQEEEERRREEEAKKYPHWTAVSVKRKEKKRFRKRKVKYSK